MTRTLGCLLLILAALPSPGVRAQSVERFLARADAVFVGRVIDQRSGWDSQHRLIWTDHVFAVQSWLKGVPTEIAVVREPGGKVANTTLTVSHSVDYHREGTYLVFLSKEFSGRTLDGESGRIPVLESGDGNSYIRLYSEHPLAELAKETGQTLLEIGTLTSRLRQRIHP